MNNIIMENVQYAPINIEASANFDLCQFISDKNDDNIVQIVAGIGKVRQVVCYTLSNGEVLVGVLSEPLFSLSERLNLLKDIETEVGNFTNNNVYVTLDTDLFVAISKCKEDAKASQVKELIIMRNSARM